MGEGGKGGGVVLLLPASKLKQLSPALVRGWVRVRGGGQGRTVLGRPPAAAAASPVLRPTQASKQAA